MEYHWSQNVTPEFVSTEFGCKVWKFCCSKTVAFRRTNAIQNGIIYACNTSNLHHIMFSFLIWLWWKRISEIICGNAAGQPIYRLTELSLIQLSLMYPKGTPPCHVQRTRKFMSICQIQWYLFMHLLLRVIFKMCKIDFFSNLLWKKINVGR